MSYRLLRKNKRSSVYKAEGKIISSEDNMPVAGVSIVVKGEKTGVITDSGGNFNIDLPDSKVIHLLPVSSEWKLKSLNQSQILRQL